MARQVFFSFNYNRDIFRVNVVRKSGFLQEETGFIDHSLWEESKTKGDEALQELIDNGLKGASVTAVLIGADSANRKWINYEIQKSWNDGKGLFGIRIHNIKDINGKVDYPGTNPFESFQMDDGSGSLARNVVIYDWVNDDGYNNLSTWIETAAIARGR